MTPVRTMEHMLRKLLKEMDYVQSQGAGYYTCSPFATSYNRLLGVARTTVGEGNPLIATFAMLDESDRTDPGDKHKRLLEIRIEITQLIGFLETLPEETSA